MREKTNQDCAVIITKGNLNGIDITVGATNFEFIGGSSGAAETDVLDLWSLDANHNQTPFIFWPCGGGQRCLQVLLL